MSEKLELICPNCSYSNSANLKIELHCKHCKEELTDKIYIKKPMFNISTFKSIIIGITIGIFVSFLVYVTFKQNRYSAKEEYSLINNCINKNKDLFGQSPTDKLEICVKAYNQTLTEKKDFKSLLEKNVAIITH